MSDCGHYQAVPVDLAMAPHERVAWLCPDCGQQLPADHIPQGQIGQLLARLEDVSRRMAKLRELGVTAGPTWDRLAGMAAQIRAELRYLSP